MQARAVAEARVDADRMLLATQSALDADGDLLSALEHADIDVLMNALRGLVGAAVADTATAPDAATIEAATKALANGTEAFAAARMNRGIQTALAGKNISAV